MIRLRQLFARVATCLIAGMLLTAPAAQAQLTKPFKKGKSNIKPVYPPATAAAGVKIELDVPFLGDEREEKMDVYLPKDAQEGQVFPCVIAVHGGGFTGGNKSDSREQNICNLLAQRGYVAASINYRLSDASLVSGFPTNIYDCKQAIRFLRKNAVTYHIDPKNFGVIGGAAGGYLSTMLALTKDGDDLDPKGTDANISCHVQAVVNMYGTVDLAADLASITNFTAERFLKKVQTAWPKERLEKFSPVARAHGQAVPLLILHGSADPAVPIAQSEKLTEALKQADATNYHFIVLPEVKTSFDLTSSGLDLRETVMAFFDRHLKGKTGDLPKPAKLPASKANEGIKK